jgi:hypothetical protein
MTRTAFSTLLLGALVCATGNKAVETTQTPAAICRSDAGGAWKLIAKGMLALTKSERTTDYRLTVGEHAFAWSSTRNRDQSISATMPKSLIRTLIEDPERFDRSPGRPVALDTGSKPVSMSLSANGEIREHEDGASVAVVLGATCPK